MGGRRFSKLENIGDYIRDIEKGGDAIEESESIGPDLAFREALIFGLRKTDGIRLDEIRRRYPSTDSGRLQQTLEKWSLDELIVLDPPRVRLSSKGLRLWDRIAEEIIAVR
jgi:coproporphyrinogen III oxidase-like Fe-S oxidoreductase